MATSREPSIVDAPPGDRPPDGDRAVNGGHPVPGATIAGDCHFSPNDHEGAMKMHEDAAHARGRMQLFTGASRDTQVHLARSRKALTLDFGNVHYQVPITRPPPAQTRMDRFVWRPLRSLLPQALNERTYGWVELLHGVSGVVRPGEFCAILGGSGAGKTTLLNAIAGRSVLPPSQGSVTFNGRTRTHATRRLIGYVMQDDVFFSNLTVEQTLRFTASIRLPRTMTREEKRRRVDEVLRFLNLYKARNTIIGDQQFNKGISGGERKRTNIAETLLTNPSLLLLDEPTSGLDSTTALSVVRLLKDLALSEGRTVVATVHQPSSVMWSEFDKVLLLAEGSTVYFGPASEATAYFERQGFRLPYGYNPADYLLDLLVSGVESGGRMTEERWRSVPERVRREARRMFGKGGASESLDVSEEDDEKSASVDSELTASMVLRAAWRLNEAEMMAAERAAYESRAREYSTIARAAAASNRDRARAAEGERAGGEADRGAANGLRGVFRSFSRLKPTEGVNGGDGIAEPHDAENDGDDDEDEVGEQYTQHKYAVSWYEQFRALALRAIQQRAGVIFTFLTLTQTLALSLLVLLIWLNSPNNEKGIYQRLGLAFFSGIFWSFFALFNSITSFPSEKAVLAKDRSAGSYMLSAYFLAKTSIESPLELIYPYMYAIMVYFAANLQRTASAFFLFLVLLSLLTLVAQSMGYWISSMVMEFKQAQVIASLWMLGSMLVAGFYIPESEIPVWLRWIRYVSFVFYGYVGLIINEFQGTTYQCASGGSTSSDTRGASFPSCNESPPKPITPSEIYNAYSVNTTFGVGGSIGMLVMFLIVLRLLAYFTLKYIQKVKK